MEVWDIQSVSFQTMMPRSVISPIRVMWKNFTTDNISVRHLLNIQRNAYRHINFCGEHQRGGAFCCDANLTIDEIDAQCLSTEKKTITL